MLHMHMGVNRLRKFVSWSILFKENSHHLILDCPYLMGVWNLSADCAGEWECRLEILLTA
jgi:hypothetical protein